jgi:hypothetical protein
MGVVVHDTCVKGCVSVFLKQEAGLLLVQQEP